MSALVTVGCWGALAAFCAYHTVRDALHGFEERRHPVKQPHGLRPDVRPTCATSIRDLPRDGAGMDAQWPRPRPVADPLIDELERLYNAPSADLPRGLR